MAMNLFALAALFVLGLLCDVASSDLRLDGGAPGWEVEAWRVQVDGVMGGRSSGNIQFQDEFRTMVFAGDINLNGGGFSSVRRDFFQHGSSNTIDLSHYAGIVVEVETDQFFGGSDNGSSTTAPLGLHLQFHDSKSPYGFAAAFAVPLASEEGLSTSLFIPMEDIDRGTRWGRRCSSCSLDTTAINGMNIYVLFQEGEFEVRLKSITAVENARAFVSPAVAFNSDDDIIRLLEATIKSGGSLYDKDYEELCISIYWSTINTIIAASEGVEESLKRVACAGVFQATQYAPSSDTDVAWALRYTMDAMIADLKVVERDVDFDWLPSAVDSFVVDECGGITSMVPDYSIYKFSPAAVSSTLTPETSYDDVPDDISTDIMPSNIIPTSSSHITSTFTILSIAMSTSILLLDW